MHQDAPAAGGRRASSPGREDAVITRLQSLGTALDGEPDPAFRAATRARLVAMAAVRLPAPAPRSRLQRLLAARAPGPSPRWRNRLTAGLAGAALTVTALATLVAVSSNARPGDALYGLKRGTEQTQLALTGDSRGQTLLDFATTRLAEVGGLVGNGGSPDSALLLDSLRTMDSETTEGAAWLTAHAVDTRSTAPVDALENWTSGQSAGLSALIPTLPAGPRTAAGRSLDLLRRVDVRAAALSTALGCPGGPATRGTDDLGPVPAPCAATGAVAPAGTGTTSGVPLPSSVPQQPQQQPGAVPADPGLPGTNAGGSSPDSTGSGPAPSAGAGLPAPVGPSLPAPQNPGQFSLPELPSLPSPKLPSLPGTSGTPLLPGAPAGGSSGGAATPSGTGGGALPSVPLKVCLPPLLTC